MSQALEQKIKLPFEERSHERVLHTFNAIIQCDSITHLIEVGAQIHAETHMCEPAFYKMSLDVRSACVLLFSSCEIFRVPSCTKKLLSTHYLNIIENSSCTQRWEKRSFGRYRLWQSCTEALWESMQRDGIYRACIIQKSIQPIPFYDFHYIFIYLKDNILTICRCQWIWCLF